ncbi:DUF4381 domain-containing protein [Desulfoluna butyratoxydans]|uniref:DUF4381 domain-containing protein n=1 Tax=Desulfoluna butyratoxydans TaxID=231438 RepID=A0A4U8YZU1_9BACT|nr:DUF4381 domain-containing protein [Desulfoluna butyratoxydans]VFQ47503.1 protein of unknown function (duf4381) [Desulfoluna butyratoxydans]
MTDPTSLDNLHDIIPFSPQPLWPPAPGWYVIAWILAAAAAWLLITSALRWKRNRYRREALAELALINRGSPPTGDELAPLPVLVKRTALAAYGRQTVAALTGEPWLAFLDTSLSTTAFTQGTGRLLIRIPYQPKAPLDPAEAKNLIHLIETWIKKHET